MNILVGEQKRLNTSGPSPKPSGQAAPKTSRG